MRYEKKMLILSGEGKGVVLLEKSGLGVKFALRTFGVPSSADLNAGIVTPNSVFVRALPSTPDPSAVFYIDVPSLDELHFAVFDSKLRLYGAIGERMWEANLMDLLFKHAHPITTSSMPTPTVLPPLAEQPKSLPLPDGTGLPQSRLSIYGDDALAENDFYTPFDIGSRMRDVDGFLDKPRILDGLAPTVTPPAAPQAEAAAESDDEKPSISTFADDKSDTDTENETDINAEAKTEADKNADGDEEADEATPLAFDIDRGLPDNIDDDIDDVEERQAEREAAATEAVVQEQINQEAAATSAEQVVINEQTAPNIPPKNEKPWELTARWLASQCSREPIVRAAAVKQIKPKTEIRTIRVADFFERCRADVEKLFADAPVDEELCKLLPDLKWVKVALDGHSISVGRDGDMLLCYAVLGNYEKVSPLGAEAQWLPRLKTAPTGKGYWLIFQSLSTGEVVS